MCIWEVLGSGRVGAWQKDEAHGLGLILLSAIKGNGGGKAVNLKFPE